MKKNLLSYIYGIFILLVPFTILSASLGDKANNKPVVHILMPAYNADRYVQAALQSVAAQDYPNLRLFILNDAATDKTAAVIEEYLALNPALKAKVYLASNQSNLGVTMSRTKLLEWSKKVNPAAYICWLDTDDKYIDSHVVGAIMEQMQKTKADICLFDFAITYEDENQKKNAPQLLQANTDNAKIINEILSSPNQSVAPLQLPQLLRFTSLGWTKCYAPTITLPKPANRPFQDFVYMAALLEAKTITALPAEYKGIEYLRRSSSICGRRTNRTFTEDIPIQLLKFFDTVLVQSNNSENELQKVTMAQEFVLRKLDDYSNLLNNLIKDKTFPDINDKTRVIYRDKIMFLEKYTNEAIQLIKDKQR